MKSSFIAGKFLLILILFVIAFTSCKKTTTTNTTNLFQLYLDSNILNRNFIVNLANNNGTDITSTYNGYTFKLLKTDYYHGPLQVNYGSNIYTGSWISNDDFSKLTITLPSTPAIFVFLTREWRFTSKNIPELDLAPWGSTEPVVLHIIQQ